MTFSLLAFIRRFAYRPVRQSRPGELWMAHLIIHAAVDVATLSKGVRSAASAIDPELSVGGVSRLDESRVDQLVALRYE